MSLKPIPQQSQKQQKPLITRNNPQKDRKIAREKKKRKKVLPYHAPPQPLKPNNYPQGNMTMKMLLTSKFRTHEPAQKKKKKKKKKKKQRTKDIRNKRSYCMYAKKKEIATSIKKSQISLTIPLLSPQPPFTADPGTHDDHGHGSPPPHNSID